MLDSPPPFRLGLIRSHTRAKRGAETATDPSRNDPLRLLGSPVGIAAELRELAELRDSGILTDEEFSEQKRRLLGR